MSRVQSNFFMHDGNNRSNNIDGGIRGVPNILVQTVLLNQDVLNDWAS